MQVTHARLSLPAGCPISFNRHIHVEVVGIGDFPGRDDGWTECAASCIDFCLWQIEWILAFDAARTHVVSYRIANNLTVCIDDQCQFWFRDIPGRVRSHCDRLIWSRN